ncbi:MAG TPA: MMPL family transporter, partial [Polyangiaceae bacterium]
MVLRLIQLSLRHRGISIAILVASILLSLASASRVRLGFQFRDGYAYPGSPHYPALERYSREFGDPGGYVVVLLEADDVFRKQNLAYIKDLTRDLQPEPAFIRIRSLATVPVVRLDGETVESGPLLEDLPDSPERIARLRAAALGSRLLVRRLISRDGKATAVLAELRKPAVLASTQEQKEAIAAVAKAVAQRPPPPGLSARITGAPVLETTATDMMLGDQLVLIPAVLTVILLTLVVIFRSIQGVLLSLAPLAVTVIWFAGMLGLTGRPIDILGSSFLVILLTYAVVDPIFMLTRYLSKIERGYDREGAILESLSELILPCFLASVTTALGFAAFAVATLPMVRYFGYAIAAGVMFAFLTTIAVLPLLLSLVPPPRRASSSFPLSRALRRVFDKLWRALNARRRIVIAAGLFVLALGMASGASLRIDNHYVGLLADGPERDAVLKLEEKLSGVVRLVVYLEGSPGAMRRPDVLRAIATVDALAEQYPLVNSSISLMDLLAEMNAAFNADGASAREVADYPALVAQYLTFVDPAERADFVNDDQSRSHIAILIEDPGSAAVRQLRVSLQRAIDQQQFDKLGI